EPKYFLIEKAMNIWVSQVSAAGLILTDELITNYKKQNSLRRYKLHGEAASTLLKSLPNERIKLQNLLSQYELEDVCNADETGLFYRMLPNQTLAKQPVARSKQDKSWATVLLAANITSLYKLRTLTLSVNNIENDDYQSSFENEDLMNDSLGSRDNDETERSLEKQQKGQCGSTRGRPRGSTHRRLRGSTCGRPCRSICGRQ
ncbi:16711_t:CDS:2, partial [Dentiscutata heterogama]